MCPLVNHICVRARLFRFLVPCATFVFRAPIFIVQCRTIPHDSARPSVLVFLLQHISFNFFFLGHKFYQGGAFEHNTQVRWHRPRSWRKSHGRSCCVEGLQLFHPMRCRDALCVVPASIVHVVCFSSLCLSECRSWPTLNKKHKFAHILLRRPCQVMNARLRRSVAAVFLFVACVLGDVRISLVAKMCLPRHKKLLLMCGLVDQVCFRVRVFCAASEEL